MKKSERNKTAAALIQAAEVLEGGTYGQVTHAVRKALKKVRGPQGGRKKTIVAIVKVLRQDPTLMNAIAERAAEYGEPPSVELIRDWIGQPLMDWREGWEIDDYDSPYDGLTYDIAPMLAKAALKWKPTGESAAPPMDYVEAGIQLSNLERIINRLEKARSYNEEKDHQEVRERVAKLAKAVGLEVKRGVGASALQAAARSAEDEYEQRVRFVKAQVMQLEHDLRKHQQKQKRDPTNWGYAGDLGQVNEMLKDVLAFLQG